MDDSKVICSCFNVTVGDIKKAIDNGASNFSDVQAATNVSKGCTGCQSTAEKIVADMLK